MLREVKLVSMPSAFCKSGNVSLETLKMHRKARLQPQQNRDNHQQPESRSIRPQRRQVILHASHNTTPFHPLLCHPLSNFRLKTKLSSRKDSCHLPATIHCPWESLCESWTAEEKPVPGSSASRRKTWYSDKSTESLAETMLSRGGEYGGNRHRI